MSRGQRQTEGSTKARRLQYNGNQPLSSGEFDFRISSSCTLIRNESRPNNRLNISHSRVTDNLKTWLYLKQTIASSRSLRMIDNSLRNRSTSFRLPQVPVSLPVPMEVLSSPAPRTDSTVVFKACTSCSFS
ncbi:unnamed protein product [Protopolystoma xenopodis]|uniref:Uncharacterized protein n=1 Tax=Protopolystoma xenopodis TaxID=117903 RepID=A0A3S5AT73_9PLAT|nr:unnamed protein product [Protopolystoma xenopodis]